MFVGIPSFIDGRADLYGDEFLARDAAATAGIGAAPPDLLDHYAIAWTLFEPSSPSVSLLDHLARWERVYADAYAVVHRKKLPRRKPPVAETAAAGKPYDLHQQVRETASIFPEETALPPLTSLAKHNEPHAEKTPGRHEWGRREFRC
jgi:hypothetical protein